MPINDLDLIAKNAIRNIINAHDEGDYFTFNGLAVELDRLNAPGDNEARAKGLGKRISNAIKKMRELRRNDPNPIDQIYECEGDRLHINYAKMFDYPTLQDKQMIVDAIVQYPWRDTDGNAIVYRKLAGQVGEL